MDRILKLLPLPVLIAAYSIIAFYNLGDKASPQTVWSESDSVIIDFGEMRHIARFQFLPGARNEIPFMLFASADGVDWHFGAKVSDFSVFAWSEQHVNTSAKYAQIVPFSPGLRLQEVAFFDHNDQLIPPHHLFTPGSEALFDEQHLVPLRGSFMNSTYFDEIYHARTAYEYLHGLTVFETTHPPMGKNFIAMGIAAFGMTPFGWRLPGTLAGILMIPLMYIFGRMMFGALRPSAAGSTDNVDNNHVNTLDGNFWGMFCAFIFAFDFMPFAQTRIATIDSFVTLFIIASYLCIYAYIRENSEDNPVPSLLKSLLYLAGSGLFIGFAVASKWQGLYALAGLPFLFFPAWLKVFKRDRKEAWITFGTCFVFFIAIPVVVYVLSYIPFVRAADSDAGFLSIIIANQLHMFSYHSELPEGHIFSSRWWEWPLLIRPIFYYSNWVSHDVRQGISSFGNPAVWWTGIFAAFYAIRALILKLNLEPKHKQAIIFLLIAYAAQYVPWVFVSRATFIYHYFPSVPFVVLLIAFFFKHYIAPKEPGLIWGYGTLVLGLFIIFHPVLSAAPVSLGFVETFLRWLPAWVLVG